MRAWISDSSSSSSSGNSSFLGRKGMVEQRRQFFGSERDGRAAAAVFWVSKGGGAAAAEAAGFWVSQKDHSTCISRCGRTYVRCTAPTARMYQVALVYTEHIMSGIQETGTTPSACCCEYGRMHLLPIICQYSVRPYIHTMDSCSSHG